MDLVKLQNTTQFHYSSVQFSHSVISDSLWPHGLQHARLPYPSPTPRAYSNSCPLSRWCHPTISSSVTPFSSSFSKFVYQVDLLFLYRNSIISRNKTYSCLNKARSLPTYRVLALCSLWLHPRLLYHTHHSSVMAHGWVSASCYSHKTTSLWEVDL